MVKPFAIIVISLVALSAPMIASVAPLLERADAQPVVWAQLVESLSLIGVDRVQRELGLTGAGIGVLVIDDWTLGELGYVHGQAVAETIRAVAPGADLWLCKLDFSQVRESDLVACLEEIEQRGLSVRVANMSFSTSDLLFSRPCDSQTTTDPLAQAIHRLTQRGVIVVAASGNDGAVNALRFPACLSDVISVGATYDLSGFVEFDTRQVFCRDRAAPDRVACYSDVAGYLDVVAPGTVISTPSAPNFGGTSAAAPLVSGVIALLLSTEPSLTRAEIVSALRATGVPAFDPRTSQTFPRIDAYGAVRTRTAPSSGGSVSSVFRFDADGDGRLSDPEFFAAIDAWVSGEIGNELFFAAIDAWIGGRPLLSARAPDALRAGVVSLRLFDLQGRPIASLTTPSNRSLTRALQTVLRARANGVYLYVARFPDGSVRIGKIALLR
jgi:subtilisin family serine protease